VTDEHIEPWPFDWSAPTRGMNHLDVEWAREDERRQVREALPAVTSAMREMPAAFAALAETMQQLREALGKFRETGQ
jgi:hypothetical protein